MDPSAVTVQVHLTARSFRDFYWFDAVRRKRVWLRPVLFAAALCALAAVCFAFQHLQRGAALLGVVLAVVGLGLPLVFFSGIARFVSRQTKALGLDQGPRHIATVTLSAQGVLVEGGKEPLSYDWDGLCAAYRAPQAVYLYAREDQAYLLPDADAGGHDAVWDLLTARMAPEKLQKIR